MTQIFGTMMHIFGTMMHIFGTMTHIFGTMAHILGTMTHIFGTMTHIFGTMRPLLTVVDRCWPVFLTVFDICGLFLSFFFKLFLTLLTMFGCISYTYERANCWPLAAFLVDIQIALNFFFFWKHVLISKLTCMVFSWIISLPYKKCKLIYFWK